MVQQAQHLLTKLRQAGHEAWWVGGCVRDLLLGRPLKDIDIATSARPDEVANLFPAARYVGASFGVTLVRLEGHTFEVTTFRSEGTYSDRRRPDSVAYGDITQDAHRRDFTVNALYYDPFSHHVVDLVGGRQDLDARLLRAVGDPHRRFEEDALRLLRAIRFAAAYGLHIEENTWAALCQHAPSVKAISAERIRDELTRMLTGDSAGRALRLLEEAGILPIVLPEVSAMRGVRQGRQYHPEGDVFIHTLLAVEKVEPRTPLNVWATLLHDVGKPVTFSEDEAGRISFYQHDKVGAQMALEICRRLRFPQVFAGQVASVVERHMRFLTARQWNKSTMARFIAAETIESDLAVHRADSLASHGDLSALELVRSALGRARSKAEEPGLPPVLVTGRDLIDLGLTPGPQFGGILEQVREWQLNEEVSTREEAIERVRRERLKGG
jgi:poly(A) polymerase